MLRISSLLLAAACQGGTIRIGEVVPDTDLPDDSDVADTDPVDDTDPDPPSSCVDHGVVVGAEVLLDQNGRIDSFIQGTPDEPRDFADVATNATQACAIEVESGRIGGDVWVGPGAYPDVVVCKGRSGRVVGDQDTLTERVPLIVTSVPSNMPDNGGDKVIAWNDEQTFKADRVFDDLVLETGGKLAIEGKLRILARTVTFNSGTLSLKPGSTLDLFVTGAAELSWNSALNVGGDPSALRIHLVEGSAMTMETGAKAWAWVDGVDSKVTLSGAELYGVLQARRLEVTWNAALRVDESALCP